MSTMMKKKKMSTNYVGTLAPEQRRRMSEQRRADADLMVRIWKANPHASRHDLEQLYWEQGGDCVHFDAALSAASSELMWEAPGRSWKDTDI